MTAEMVEVHLVVVADLLLVVAVRVAAEYDEVVAHDVGRVEGTFARHKALAQVLPDVVDLGPVAAVELESEHAIRQLGETCHTGNDAPVD